MPEPLFNIVAGLRPATFLKKRPWRGCFPVNFAKFLRTPFYRTPLVDASEDIQTKRILSQLDNSI